jgi:hypothetical protein
VSNQNLDNANGVTRALIDTHVFERRRANAGGDQAANVGDIGHQIRPALVCGLQTFKHFSAVAAGVGKATMPYTSASH